MALTSCNTHPFDELITLDERAHKYIYHSTNGKSTLVPMSVTGLVSKQFNTFDGPTIVRKGVPKWLMNTSHELHKLCKYLQVMEKLDNDEIGARILEYWKEEGRIAAEKGTAMHKVLEDYIEGCLVEDDAALPIVAKYERFIVRLRETYPKMDLRPWRTEFKCVHVIDENPLVAGCIDFIMIDANGHYWLFDWKRVDPKKKGLLGQKDSVRPQPVRVQRALGAFQAVDATSYNQYSAQLLMYKYILENSGYNMTVAACMIVQIHDDLDEAHMVNASNMDNEVDALMQTLGGDHSTHTSCP
tara:strand:+ start:80 stop:979 length:900 start_codon:yes stop_codon:yes gene_type:complete